VAASTSRATNHHVARYSGLPDIPDQRDHLYEAPVAQLKKLPPKVDLRAQCSKLVYDQGQLGSCTGNAIACAIQFERLKQKLKPDFLPSRLFIYYNEHAMEDAIDSDSGAQIRNGIKSVAQLGDCPESEWPYVIEKIATKPTAACYREALKYKAVLYQRVAQTVNQIKGCLASLYPFVFGFSVYESFESPQVAQTDVAPMPASSERQMGGHAVIAVGHDDAQQRFVVRNSWGNGWGMKGYFTLLYAYLADGDLAADFWTVQVIAQ